MNLEDSTDLKCEGAVDGATFGDTMVRGGVLAAILGTFLLVASFLLPFPPRSVCLVN